MKNKATLKIAAAAALALGGAMRGLGDSAHAAAQSVYQITRLPELETVFVPRGAAYRAIGWSRKKQARVLRAAFGGRVPKVRRIGSYCPKRSR